MRVRRLGGSRENNHGPFTGVIYLFIIIIIILFTVHTTDIHPVHDSDSSLEASAPVQDPR
jgi:hypothetical protein